MDIKHTTRIWLIPLALGFLADQLFFGQVPGITFPIFSAIVLAAGLFIAAGEGKKPRAASLVLIVPILFFAVMAALRTEPFTRMINILFTLGGMLILAATLLGGQWLRYGLVDLLLNPLMVIGSAFFEPLRFFSRKKTPIEGESTETAPTSVSRPWIAVVRGLLLAVPVIALLTALLASADPVFSDGLERFLAIFNTDNLAEYIMRLVTITAIAFLLLGVYLYATLRSQNEKLTGLDKPLIAPFLGSIEASVILTLVNLLFALFVAIQVRYFFGGAANIHIDGFTYAEYARRGFGELVAVAIVSLLLLQGLSAVVRRLEKRQGTIFSALGVTLVLLVLVILVSAFQRLWLYESAYGYTQTRTYTHIFMIWLGILLVATLVLEITRNTRAFAIATLLAALGFAISLNVVNVDRFVVHQNILRAQMGYELDAAYFLSLSSDATPLLVEIFQRGDLAADAQDRLGAVLACKSYPAEEKINYQPDWRSWILPNYLSSRALTAIQPALNGYTVMITGYETHVRSPLGIEQSCSEYQWMD